MVSVGGLGVALGVIATLGYVNREPKYVAYKVLGRWRHWWLAMFLADLMVLSL